MERRRHFAGSVLSTLKTEAQEALGVRSIIDDASVYDYLKVMSRFVTLAGYSGFLVMLDECVNLFKLVSAQSRNANYEQILRIVNDVLQGSAESSASISAAHPDSDGQPPGPLFLRSAAIPPG